MEEPEDGGAVPTPAPPVVRVGYLIDHMSPGGAERLMVEYLPRLPRFGVDPVLVALNRRGGGELGDELAALDVPVEVLGVERMADPRGLPRVVGAMRRWGVQVVHSQLEVSDLLGPIAARLMRMPSVSTLHTIPKERSTGRTRIREGLAAFSLRRLCDRIVAVSEAARLHHERVDRLPASRLIAINNGVDLARFRPADTAARARARSVLDVPAEARVVLTVAVLREPKGIQHMISAMPALARHAPGALYVVAGDGPHRSALEGLAREAGVSDRVRFVGSRGDVETLMQGADLFVLPSLEEALPTVIAEALGVGLPVVATTVGGVPEMIEDGSSGLLVPPSAPQALADACARILGDQALAARLAARGREVAEARFDRDRQLRRLADLYRELVALRRARR